MKRKINIDIAKQISIIRFLKENGLYPKKSNGINYWYFSPFRNEKTPSFKVNTALNVWFDYGIGVGGTIIDLGIKLYNCSIPEFLEKLTSFNFSFQQQLLKKEKAVENKMEIIEIKKLSNVNLINYIKERRINHKNAIKYCKEIHFKHNNKLYYALGFMNNSNGYEIRNKYFKSCFAPKDITLIKNGSKYLSIFEGFMDMLSWFEISNKHKNTDYLVLNSIAMFEKAKQHFSSYEKVFLYLDNDSSGKDIKKKITETKLSSFEDMSIRYEDFKDLNDFVISTAEQNRRLNNHHSLRL